MTETRKYQLQVLGALLLFCGIAVGQRWYGPLFPDYWRGVFTGMFSTFLIMRTKQQVLERALADARKGSRHVAPV